MQNSITVKAYALIFNADRTRHLVWEGRDDTKEPTVFHRLLGGHVEFGERAVEAVVREIAEELRCVLSDPRFLGVLESLFVHLGEPGHEVVFIYAGTIPPEAVPPEGGWFDDGGPIRVEWRPVAGGSAIPLYPDGMQEVIDRDLTAGELHELPVS